MPIKWNITAKAMKARGLMDQISAEYDGFIADGSEHLGDVKALKGQVGEMKDDLYAAANVMGNGSGNGSPDSQPPAVVSQTVAPAIQQPVTTETEPVTPASPAAPPAVGPVTTFPGS